MKRLFLFVCLLSVTAGMHAKNEIYAVRDGGKMTLYYDDQKSVRNGDAKWWEWDKDTKNLITEAVFDISFQTNDAKPISTEDWFYNFENLENIENLNRLNTSEVFTMTRMFYPCKSLKSIDLSGFNTEKVESMAYMFAYCESLESLNLSGFNTEKVTQMTCMFSNCKKLTTLDLMGFNTDKVTNMSSMFQNCYALRTLYINFFTTTNLTGTASMFNGCENLETIYCDEDFTKATKLENSNLMFAHCNKLKGNNNTAFDKTKTDVTYARPDGGAGDEGYFSAMPDFYAALDESGTLTYYFDYEMASRNAVADTHDPDVEDAVKKAVIDPSIQKLQLGAINGLFADYRFMTAVEGLSNLDCALAGDLSEMFKNCVSLTAIDLSDMNLKSVTNLAGLFEGCKALKTINFGDIDTKNVSDMSSLFQGCSALEELDLGAWTTDNADDMSSMFYGCTSLKKVSLKGWNTENVHHTFYMFRDCESLEELDLTGFNTAKTADMYQMFDGCKALKRLVLDDGFVTSVADDLSGMFRNCESIEELPLGKLTIPNVTNLGDTKSGGMFEGCKSLRTIDLSGFTADKAVSAVQMFAGCESLESIGCKADFSTLASLADATDMFAGCVRLAGDKGTVFDPAKADNSYARPDGGEEKKGYFSEKVKTANYFGKDITWEVKDDVLYIYGKGDMPQGAYKDIPWNKHKTFVTEIRIESDEITSICDSAFYDFGKVESVAYPENTGLTKIGRNAFALCEHLKNLVIPDNVTKIGEACFGGCEDATSLTLSKNMTSIPDNAFVQCQSLKKIVIPDNITELGVQCFAACTSATKLTLSKNITVIPEGAFASCASLHEIVIPDHITEIGVGSFMGCETATSLTLSKNITSIPKAAFYACKGLEEIVIPDNITLLGVQCFNECESATSLTLSKNLKTIPEIAFAGCIGLTDIVIPYMVAELDEYCFESCTALESVRLPRNLLVIGEGAFEDCDAVKDVTCPALVPPTLGDDAFEDIKGSGAKLHVYKSFAAAYTETAWAYYFTIDGSLLECKVTASSADEALGKVSLTFDKEDILSEKDGVFIVRENAKAHLTATVTGENAKFVRWNDDAEDNTQAERDVTVTSDFDFIATFAQTPTGVDTAGGTDADRTAVRKLLRNGTLLIDRHGTLFDALGHRLN